MRRRSIGVVLLVATWGVSAEEAWAQQRPQPRPAPQRPAPPRRRTPPKWAIAVYGGGVLGQSSTSGSSSASFPVGAAFTAQNGSPTRAVASWYLNDGASLFGQVRAQFASQFALTLSDITPLNPTLTSAAARRATGASFGVRLSRELSRRYTLEIGFDRTMRPLALTAAAKTNFETTRASFVTAFTSLFNTVPQSGLSLSSTLEVTEPGGGQTALSAAVSISLVTRRKLEAHATVGAGIVANGSATLDAKLRGNYGFLIFGTYPINETDTVTLHVADRHTAPMGLFGGGINYNVTARQSLRVDVRLLASANGLTQTVDATPASTKASTASFLPSNTSPSIQFSSVNNVPSSLSGSPVRDLSTFSGSGLEFRALLTVAWAVKF